ncbi:ASCH domain-containing protein [Actinotalea sp. M2MS4P-6]|uniref:ASCH domain-containing protein n=1 Tax=Actinotalea sp. M2MS4P-6 TaxID=2983762 RepID=UPI0021E42DAF|nr:ASCH domain-containing protein [Actinotalea sp. M2MS4P-6]MCV2394038.1 ASCH domain-containing protein [Actinotalea sp. M2MS4P-6]
MQERGGQPGPEDRAPDSDDTARVALLEFWEVARPRAKVAPVPEWTGLGVVGSIVPPAWSFGDSPELADSLLQLVLDGVKTGTSTAAAELVASDEPEPRRGDLSIVLDGRGRPGALIRTTSVTRCRFDEVDAEHAAAEGEDDRSLTSWRAEHERYWRRVLPAIGVEFSPALELVLERFTLLYPRPNDR